MNVFEDVVRSLNILSQYCKNTQCGDCSAYIEVDDCDGLPPHNECFFATNPCNWDPQFVKEIIILERAKEGNLTF